MKIKEIRKIWFLFLIVLTLMFTISVGVKATVENLIVDGRKITLSDGSSVQINTTHEALDGEFRAVWVSALTGDITGFTNKEQYKLQMVKVIETMEYYNLNVMIFHVRIMNDAFYKSSYNSYSSYYSLDPSWDMLPWLIEECHKHGIEFHAWMNPYRVTTNVSLSLGEVSKNFLPTNAASDPKNLLKADKCIILNPGEPDVQTFLVNTCMELVQKYDVDAIHFDDYFYASGVDDYQTRLKYNKNLSVGDFRRLQVDTFIEELSKNLKEFNKQNNRRVQLGISPTGVYRNGNGIVSYDEFGNAITTGSASRAYSHYDSPLYADTVKWVNNNWIDYILPQTYWGITHSSGPYCDIVKWWNDVVKNKKTNLYSALGLYMIGQSGNASWGYNDLEGYQQIMYANSLPYVKGCSIYNYLSMSGSTRSHKAMKNVENIWNNSIYLPEIRTQEIIKLDKVKDLKINSNDYGYTLSFDKMDDAKFYCIYRSEQPITYSEKEILEVIGNLEDNGRIYFTDKNVDSKKKYYYAVRPQSYSLTLGEKNEIDTTNITKINNMSIGDITGFQFGDVIQGMGSSIYFDRLFYPFGSEIQYQLTISIDGKETVYDNFEIERNLFKKSFNVSLDAKNVKATLKAYNDLGESINTIERSVSSSLGNITIFTVNGNIYSSNDTRFTISDLGSEIDYIVQYSKDNINFTDLKNPVTIKHGKNIELTVKSLDFVGEVYYRIKATKDDRITYSSSIKALQKKYLNGINNVLINDLKDVEILKVNENDIICISWNASNDINYSLLYSINNIDFSSINSYTRNTEKVVKNNTISIFIPIDYSEFKLMFKITGNTIDGYCESETYTVYVTMNDLYVDEVLRYFKNDEVSFLNNMNIFK